MRPLLIVTAGILSRMFMLVFFEPSTGGDGVHYLRLALKGFGAFSDTFRPPLYPLTISPFLAIGGVSLVYAFQSALTIGAALYASRWTYAGALLIATSPFLIIYEYTILAETLTIALLTTGWLVLSRPGARRAALAGLLFGLAGLTRETVIILTLFALPFGYWMRRTKDFVIVAAVAVLLFLPWAIQSAGGEGRMGYNLWVGTWERNGEWYKRGGVSDPDYPANAFTSLEQQKALKPGAPDTAYREAAIERIVSEPLFVASNWIARYPKLWVGTRTDQVKLNLQTGSRGWLMFKSVAWGLAFMTLLAGLASLWRRWYWAIPVAYTALIYLPFHNVEPRYSLVVFPLLYIAIGLQLQAWSTKRRQAHERRSFAPDRRNPSAAAPPGS